MHNLVGRFCSGLLERPYVTGKHITRFRKDRAVQRVRQMFMTLEVELRLSCAAGQAIAKCLLSTTHTNIDLLLGRAFVVVTCIGPRLVRARYPTYSYLHRF